MAEQTLLLFQFLDLVGPRYWKDCTSSSCTLFIRISAVMAFTMTLLSTVLIFIQGGKFFREDHEIYIVSKAEVTELPLLDWYGGVVAQ